MDRYAVGASSIKAFKGRLSRIRETIAWASSQTSPLSSRHPRRVFWLARPDNVSNKMSMKLSTCRSDSTSWTRCSSWVFSDWQFSSSLWNLLCSDPWLSTICERQLTTSHICFVFLFHTQCWHSYSYNNKISLRFAESTTRHRTNCPWYIFTLQ